MNSGAPFFLHPVPNFRFWISYNIAQRNIKLNRKQSPPDTYMKVSTTKIVILSVTMLCRHFTAFDIRYADPVSCILSPRNFVTVPCSDSVIRFLWNRGCGIIKNHRHAPWLFCQEFFNNTLSNKRGIATGSVVDKDAGFNVIVSGKIYHRPCLTCGQFCPHRVPWYRSGQSSLHTCHWRCQ